MLKVVSTTQAAESGALELPVFYGSVRAGFPTPADDGAPFDNKLDLNALLIKYMILELANY